jgi:hypothetical protein
MPDVYVSGEDFGPKELPPPGPTNAVCAFVEDVGEEFSEMYQKTSRKIVLIFELEDRMEDNRPFMLSQTFTGSLGEKANLRKALEGWRGRKFTPEELVKFNVGKLVGVGCTLNVMVGPNKQGKERASIAGIMPKHKQAVALTIYNTEPPKWVAERKAKNAADAKLRDIGIEPHEAPVLDAGVGFDEANPPPF